MTKVKSSLNYETAVTELESLLAKLEGGQLPLEEAINTYRRGSELIRYCQDQLKEAEQKIQILSAGELKDFKDGPSTP